MITIFNRREVLISMDLKRASEARDLLAGNGIDYIVKTKNLQSGAAFGDSRGRTGSFGIQQDYSYEYKIYVHKKDYNRALGLIHR